MTQLYRAANKLIKTLYIARKSMMAGNDNMALLSYNEVASFFLDKNILKHDKSPKISGEPERAKFGVNKNLGICYNNIGCIHLK